MELVQCRIAGTHSEPSKVSKIKHFVKMINGFTVSEKDPSEVFDWFLNTSQGIPSQLVLVHIWTHSGFKKIDALKFANFLLSKP